jgi:recombination protein RecR
MLPEPIKNFIEVFSALPSIGRRQATRLVFRLLGSGKAKIEEMEKAVRDLKNIKLCSNCFFIHSNKGDLCDICQDQNRSQNIIAVVEKEIDLISLERTKKFKGRYLVLGELLKTGELDSQQKLRLNHLKGLIKKQGKKAAEIIIAINPTTYGDINASAITKELAPYAEKITRLGRGIPTGGEIEFADEDTLESALDRRS